MLSETGDAVNAGSSIRGLEILISPVGIALHVGHSFSFVLNLPPWVVNCKKRLC